MDFVKPIYIYFDFIDLLDDGILCLVTSQTALHFFPSSTLYPFFFPVISVASVSPYHDDYYYFCYNYL